MGFWWEKLRERDLLEDPGVDVRIMLSWILNEWGHMVAQLVEALPYKPEGREFDSRFYHCNFSLIQSFQLPYGPGVDSASNRNEYQGYLLG
jgi:hypothetical protein